MTRITHRMMLDNAVRYMNENLERLGKLQKQVASGKMIHSASDDPSTAQAILGLRSSLEAGQTYRNTSLVTLDWLEANEIALAQIIDITTRADQLIMQGMADTNASSERSTLANEIDQLLQAVIDIANTSHDGNYIFAGYKIRTKPFSLVSGAPDTVNYDGDSGIIQRSVGPGQFVTVNINGDTLFAPLFSSLITARDALAADDTSTARSALLSLRSAFDDLNAVRTTNGSRQRQLGDSIERIEKNQLALKSLLSRYEDVDLAEAISMVTHQETVYRAALEAGKLTLYTPSLFDFLR